MILDDEFSVDLDLDHAWELLTDLETIASCLPGAERITVTDGVLVGESAIKVGPMVAHYAGTAVLQEMDRASRRATIVAEGKGSRGLGSASAIIVATLAPADAGTVVAVRTDLRVAGGLAQFRRAALPQLSASLLDQFAENLEARYAQPVDGPPPAAPVAQPAPVAPAEPITLREFIGRWLRRVLHFAGR